MEKMAVFDYRNETFSPPPCDALVCSICYCVVYNPMECPCQHMFCEDCIHQWLNYHGSCPECRENTDASSLTRASRVVRNLILNLKIHCRNSSRGCLEICSVEHYEAHKRTCPYQLIECPNGNCGLEIMLKDKTKHEDSECVFYLTRCTVCGEDMVRHRLLDHNCFRELKFELEFTKEQLRKLQDEKKDLQTQVDHLRRKQAEMGEDLKVALRQILDLRVQKCICFKQTSKSAYTLQNNMETVQNVVGAMQDLLKFSESQMSRISIFLKSRTPGILGLKLPKSSID